MGDEKKINCETAIARIKIKMNNFYGSIGRDRWNVTDDLRDNLFEDIDDILDNTNIDRKRVVLESLELDKMKGGKENE